MAYRDKIKSLINAGAGNYRVLTERDTMVFLRIFMSEQNAVKQNMGKLMLWDKKHEEQIDQAVVQILEQSLPAKILFDRLRLYAPDLRMTTHLFAWLSLELTTPGSATLWAYAVYEMWLKYPKGDILTMSQWAECFPLGFPNMPLYEECWESQKTPRGEARPHMCSDNYLDWEETWAELRAIRDKA